MGIGYGGFGIMFFLAVVFVAGAFFVIAREGISAWNKNNNSPRFTVTAQIVSKRKSVSQHKHPNAGDITGAHGFSITYDVYYYLTFQIENGEQMEFSVTSLEYERLNQGDTGKLTFQGTRYLSYDLT